MQYGFYFNGTRCIGCRTCMFACKDVHHCGTDVSYRKLFEFEGGSWTQEGAGWRNDTYVYHLSVACNHCDNPACVANCPTGAMHKDEETGLVSSSPSVCIGCGTCQNVCPYGAPKVGEEGHSLKCDGCRGRVEQGKNPICVEACSLRCLEFGPIDELRAAHGGDANIAPLPDPSITSPNLVVEKPYSARESGNAEGHLANETDFALL